MFLDKFRKYIIANIISLFGYIILIFSLKFLFIDNKITKIFDTLYFNGDLFNYSYEISVIPYLISLTIIFCIIIFLVILLLLEIFLQKRIKFMSSLEKYFIYKPFVFWLGYSLIPLPLLLFFIGLITLFLSLQN